MKTPPPPGPLTVGVWIETPPDHELHGEGIARTAAAVIRGLTRRDDTRVVVAAASWSAAPVRRLLDDWDVPADRVQVITSSAREPYVVRQRRRVRRPSRAGASRLHATAARLAHTRAARWLFEHVSGVRSWPALALLALTAALLSPVMLIGGLVLAGAAFIMTAGRWLRRVHHSAAPRWQTQIRTLKPQAYAYLRDALTRNEYRLLARRANRRARADVWLILHPASVHALGLSAPCVVAVPDLVYRTFPTLFDAHWARSVDERVHQVVARAESVICYSEHVARTHVESSLNVPREAVHVIPHAPFDAAPALHDGPEHTPGLTSHARAARIVERFLEERCAAPGCEGGIDAYLRGFPFDEVPFLFVTSQVRPTKNYLNLFRAFEVLLRTRYRNVKVVMTGDLTSPGASSLREYVDRRRLHLDILSIPAMPGRVHAAFLHLAAVTVVPTLFEGGFPFPFSESLSVDTPVLMSDIPVTRAVVPEALAPLMLFDPTDVQAMVERIDWALSNRQVLLDAERPLFAQLAARTWDEVAADYRSVLAAAAASSRRG